MITQQKKISSGGLDTSNYNKFVAPDDYLYALNILNGTSNQHKGTVVQNTLGNRKVDFTLPTGVNTCIGFFEDKKSTSGIYFVKNDLGNHSVLRYYPPTGNIIAVCQEALLNFDTPIASINLVDDLLSWTTDDGNPPREFNIARMQRQDENGVFKKVKFNLYFDFVNFRAGDTYNIQYGANNVLVYSTAVDLTLEAGVADFVTQFNAAQTDFLAESCGTFVEVEAIIAGIYDVSFTGTNTNTGNPSLIQRVFINIYPQTQDGFTFLEAFINADKNPPQCEPAISVLTDINEKNNFIVSKIFQLRLSYFYVDGEQSALSPISIVSLGVGNYIKVDFTDTRLNDNNLTIIDGVGIYVKEGELGSWQFVKEIGRDEFGIGTNYYNFFNNNSYVVIDDAYAVKPHDAFPITSQAQEIADNRKMYGDIIEGYDRVCVETNLSLSYNQPPELYTVKGIIVIRPLFLFPSLFNAAVFDDATYGVAGNAGIGQDIALKGFAVYAAGTEFYGVSKQVVTWSTNQNPNTGAYNPTAGALADLVALNNSPRDAFKSGNPYNLGTDVNDGYNVRDQNGNYIGDKWFRSATNQSSLVYSTFEINGLPAGEYILRIAGVETTADDLSATGYQKTSAYTMTVGNAANTASSTVPQGFEYKIRVGANETSYVNSNGAVTASQAGNIIYVGCSAVADLSVSNDPFVQALANIITGYLCDSDLSNIPTTYDEILEDTRVERAVISFDRTAYSTTCTFNNTQQPNWSQRAWASAAAVTDHNGFFWYVSNFNSVRVLSLTAGKAGQYLVAYGQAFKKDNTPITNTTFFTPYFNRIAVRNNNINITEKAKTLIKGRVLDGVNPQLNVPAVNALGTWVRTNSLGVYEIPCYADTFYNIFISLPAGDPVRTTEIIFSNLNNSIVYDFTSDSIPVSILIGVAIGSYNNTSQSFWYLIADMQADLLEEFLGISAWKRGLAEEIAVVYFDRENRQTTVNDHIRKVYVPFYTENQTVGSAVISWDISSLPPEWATHYQFVRTNSPPRFLQFNATDVTYVDANDNSTSFTNATFIKIQLNSLLQYNERYPQSSIGYTFERGDRMRPISDGGGGLYGSYLDAEIVKDDTQASNYYIYVEKNNLFLTLDIGTLIEIYTPKPAISTLFYEFGECFEIYELDGVKYHRGQSQDQTATQNATGTFRTGNVYYRFRNFVLGGAKYIEDSSVSDFYSSFTTQTGRPQILDNNAKQVHRPTAIRFSNTFFVGSQRNGFASFEPLNVKEIDRVFGAITILRLMSQSVLLCICQHKTQTFYVSKATLNIPSNAPNLIALSDSVLNTADTLIGEWGVSDKLSFAAYNNNGWWFDKNKGAIVRYSSNGLEVLSRYKMQSYFADVSRTATFARAGYDPYHNLYNISINDETVAFNDAVEGGKNLWTSFYSYLPECYGRIGTQLISFKLGELWVHDSSTRNQFYGTQFNSEIKVTANDAPSEVKSWQALAEESSDVWTAEITIAPNVTRILGQLTVLGKNMFVKKEGVLYAAILRDMNTPNFPNTDEALINGDRIRGEVAEIKLTNDNTGAVEMFAIDLISIYSPLSDSKRG